MDRRDLVRTLTATAIVAAPAAASSLLAPADQSSPNSNQQSTATPLREQQTQQAVRPALQSLSPTQATAPPPPDLAAIKDGRAPLDRDEEAFKQTIKDFISLYGPIPQRDANGKRLTGASPLVNRKVSCRALGIDSKIAEMFVAAHVEQLLNQAADLLDRASQARDQLKEKLAKLASLALEVSDFFANDQIHQDEIVAGIYTTPYEVSAADERSQYYKKAGADNFLFYNQILTGTYYSLDAINKASARSQLLAWLTFIPTFQLPFVGDALIQTFANVALTSAQHAINATFDLTIRNANLELNALLAQAALQSSASLAYESSFEGAQAKRKWDGADISFKKRRTQAARDNADEKVRLATTPGGAFNYAEQLDSLVRRMLRDLCDALARLTVAAEGLRTIYGRDVPLPATVKTVIAGRPDEVDAVNALDDALIWVRDSIAYLVAFTQHDQLYTVTISVKQLLPHHPWPHEEEDWHKGRKSGTWKFSITDELFPSQTYVRLRGASICTRGADGNWRGSLIAPMTSYFRQANSTTVPIDQSGVPPVYAGRIAPRSPEFNGDVVGRNTLRNVAPFGEWTLTLGPSSTQSDSREDLDDIEIDFDVAVRA